MTPDLSDVIPGRPDEVAAAADMFDGAAARWRDVHDGVLARAGALAAAWRGSPSATVAEARVRHHAEAAERLGEACRAVVGPVRAFADELRRAQQDWADGAAMAGPADAVDRATIMDSAVDRVRTANEEATRALRAIAASLADLVPPETTPQVVGQDDGTFGQGLWDAGADAVGGFGSLLGGTADRLDPFGDRFGSAWAGTVATVSAAVRDPLAAAEAVIEGTVDPVVEAYRHGGMDEASGRAVGAIALAVGSRGASEVDKVGELGRLGVVARPGGLPGPPPGWHSSAERGPHTPLAPGGGLVRHEEAGGHTLAPEKAHVGATDEQMLARLATDPNAGRVSSFFDQDHAERAVAENLAANKDAVAAWLRSGKPKEKFLFDHDHLVGRTTTLDHGSCRFEDVSSTRVVLRRDATMPDGYRIITSFPDD